MNARLNRLFREDGRCLILAFDHGLFGEPSWLRGVEDIPSVLGAHVAQRPDGMTLTTGSAGYLQSLNVDNKPSLLLRSDVTNGYLADRPTDMHCMRLSDTIVRALRLDAVAVVAAILSFPGQPELTWDCLRNVDELRAMCEPYGIAMYVETLAMTLNDGVPKVSTDADVIAPMVRQAFEAGADVIKADPTEPHADFAALVTAGAGVPVLSSGGIPTTDAEVIRRSAGVLEAGASGLAYGRNVLWAEHPESMTKSLLGLVHGQLTLEEALEVVAKPTT